MRTPVRIAIGLFLVLDLVVGGADTYLLSTRSTTTVVDLQHALSHFRQASAGGSRLVSSASAGGAEAEAPPTVPTLPTSTTRAASTAPVPSPSQAPSAGLPPPTTAAASPAPPKEGVYAFRTAGGESISVLGARHDYPAETYATVRHTGGCGWDIHAEVVKEHVDDRTMCTGPTGVDQFTQSRQVTFFGSTDGATFTFHPPQVQFAAGDAPGTRAGVDCGDGKGTQGHLVRTTLGYATVTVGGVAVPVVKIRVGGTLTGRVRGTSLDLLTFDVASGLPVRWERSVDTMADAFGTSVRYQEHVVFDLVSLTPAT